MKIRGGPAAVIGEETLPRGQKVSDSVTRRDHPGGKAVRFSEDPRARRPVRGGVFRSPDGKGSRESSVLFSWLPFLFEKFVVHNYKKGGIVMKKNIIAYRKRCKKLGKNTGLSHYILLTPKAKK